MDILKRHLTGSVRTPTRQLVGNMSNPSQAGTSSNQAQQPTPDQSQLGGSSASGSARIAEEQARKDRTLTEFMLMLDDYEPMVCHRTWFSATCIFMNPDTE